MVSDLLCLNFEELEPTVFTWSRNVMWQILLFNCNIGIHCWNVNKPFHVTWRKNTKCECGKIYPMGKILFFSYLLLFLMEIRYKRIQCSFSVLCSSMSVELPITISFYLYRHVLCSTCEHWWWKHSVFIYCIRFSNVTSIGLFFIF